MNALFAAVVIAVVAILGALFFAFRGKSTLSSPLSPSWVHCFLLSEVKAVKRNQSGS